jgi:hypothetical protein
MDMDTDLAHATPGSTGSAQIEACAVTRSRMWELGGGRTRARAWWSGSRFPDVREGLGFEGAMQQRHHCQ